MTEAERVVRLLARRMHAAGFREPVLGVDNEQQYLMLDTVSRSGLKVFICVWIHPDGRIRDALTFVFEDRSASLMGKHLNNWRRSEGDFTVQQLVDSLWAAFWVHEEENRTLNRLQWMHISKLPDLDEVEHTGPPLLGAVDEDKPRRKRKKDRLIPDEHTTVFDLFRE